MSLNKNHNSTKQKKHFISLSCVLKLHPFDMYSLYLCDGNYLLLFIFLVLSCICNWCNSFFFVFSQTYAYIYIYRYIYFSKENMRERKIKSIRFSLADDQAKWNLHFFLFLSLYFLKNRENVQDRHRSEKSETNVCVCVCEWTSDFSFSFRVACVCLLILLMCVCVCIVCLDSCSSSSSSSSLCALVGYLHFVHVFLYSIHFFFAQIQYRSSKERFSSGLMYLLLKFHVNQYWVLRLFSLFSNRQRTIEVCLLIIGTLFKDMRDRSIEGRKRKLTKKFFLPFKVGLK